MSEDKIRSYQLEYDIKAGGVVAHKKGDTITVRKPQSGELRGLQSNPLIQGDFAQLQTLAGRITTPVLRKEHFDAMDPADLTQFHMEVLDFLLPSAAKQAVSPTE